MQGLTNASFDPRPPSTPAVHPQNRAKMSSGLNIGPKGEDLTAPTPQNTPLNQAPISLGLSRPTVPDISEDNENEEISEVKDLGEDDLNTVKAHMLGMVQGRLAELVGKSSGYIESLPVEVKANVEALKGVQEKQNDLVNQYKLECLQLEKKVRRDRPLLLDIYQLIFLGLVPWPVPASI